MKTGKGKNVIVQKKTQIACVLGGIGVYLAARAIVGSDRISELKRPVYGEGDAVYALEVEGLEKFKTPVEIQVSEQLMDIEQADAVFDTAMDCLLEQILGENPSLSQVRTDLNLVSWLEEYGLRVRWYSSKPEILDSFGHVAAVQMGENGEDVILEVSLSQEDLERNYQVPVKVFPKSLTEQEKSMAEFMQTIEKLNQDTRNEASLCLPSEYGGQLLYYHEAGNSGYEILLVLGVVMAILYTVKGKADMEKAKEARKRQMLLDYSEIVSKLMILLGAGMTVPLAWERLALDYEKMRREGRKNVRYAYEEVRMTYKQMKSGISESQAFRDFGRRTELNCYRKLSGYLEQNRKTGMKNLRSVLDREIRDAFEQRKNLAKKLGEEAGTKLLLPLFLMLGVVMVMIMVPALLSMY